MKKKFLSIALSAAMILGLSACGKGSDGGNKKAEAESDYPTKSIELIVPFSAGGGTDSVARSIANEVKDDLGQAVSVSNITGGSGAVGFQQAMNAKPDGYTLIMSCAELLTIPAMGISDFTYEDFKPVCMLNEDPSAITVSADAPWNTIEEFIEYAKTNEVSMGNSGIGAIWHFAAAALEQETGAKFIHTPYDGAAPAITALLGGHIDAISVSPGEAATQIASGKLKALAVMSDERIEQLPDVPTLKESGIDLTMGTWRGIAAPKDTPDEVVEKLEAVFSKAAETDAFKDTLKKLNLGYRYLDGAQHKEMMAKQYAYFQELVKTLELDEQK